LRDEYTTRKIEEKSISLSSLLSPLSSLLSPLSIIKQLKP
jgi:hypothetical protein